MWTGAILAGGQARRLGGIDKSALLVGTASILDRLLSLHELDFAPVELLDIVASYGEHNSLRVRGARGACAC